MGNGRRTDFYGDSWCGHTPLKDQFHRLYETSNDIGCSVADMASRRWRLTFRRWLEEECQYDYTRLNSKLMGMGVNDEEDRPIWKWSKSGRYTVRSLYNLLTSQGTNRSFRQLWKAKLPLKIKIWLWLIWHNAIATKK